MIPNFLATHFLIKPQVRKPIFKNNLILLGNIFKVKMQMKADDRHFKHLPNLMLKLILNSTLKIKKYPCLENGVFLVLFSFFGNFEAGVNFHKKCLISCFLKPNSAYGSFFSQLIHKVKNC